MSLVKIKASFDPSNSEQLTAAMGFLSAVGGSVIPSGNTVSIPGIRKAGSLVEEKMETTTADIPNGETQKKRAPRKKKVAETNPSIQEYVDTPMQADSKNWERIDAEEKAAAEKAAAEKAAAEKAAAEKAAAEKAANEMKAVSGSNNITLEDIRTLTSKKAKDHREEIKAKLTEWGVPNVVKIPEDKYAEFIDFLNSL